MICPTCKGVGCVGATQDNCLACNGTGEVDEVPMTNEEWIKSCTTEQLAWMISLFVGNSIAKHDCGNDEDIKPIKWVEWLKQPHTPKK